MEESPKKILFLTGTRADFGKLKPLIQEVERADEFEANIFATGMHMLSRYGKTVREIHKAGFKHVYAYINQDGAVNSQMDFVLANTVQGLGHYVRESLPDMIVVHGDRIEALAGAIVGALTNIRVAHVEGGEVSGTVDELIRHAVSKLSHLHFVANEEAKRRLVQMGESEDAILVIGSPDIDVMLSDQLPALPDVLARYEIPFLDEYVICIFHPVTTELTTLKQHAQALVAALEESNLNVVVIYPNNDNGSDIILESYASFRSHPRFRFIPSMRFEYFLSLLKHAKAIFGNSSAGIREAPVFGVPTVNIGTRQLNRFDYPSIVNVSPEKGAILKALQNLPTGVRPSLYFGKGDSAKQFIAHLRNPVFWNVSPQKQFKDLMKTPELGETVLM
ncbi:MAG: UDP-N-acetylglucosamine 2-epimerase (hydrolyzing) [Nitrospirae bacterium]|nr:UDP-N-acetylglucosamine 2-epimerase (hydrolyzing) [Nitrospirota bacterium]